MRVTLKVGALLTLSLVVLTGCFEKRDQSPPTGAKPLTVSDVVVGMSSQAFSSIFPGTKIPSNGEWTRPDEIHGLRGEWTYSFNAKHLSWFVFNSYESNVTVNTFRQYLDATKLAVADFTKTYGTPQQSIRGILQFKDPRQGYPGYPVLKASWSTANEKIRLDYSVLGNAQERAQLLFAVEYRK